MGAPGFRSDVIHQMYHWRIKIAHPIQFQIFIFPVRFDNALSKMCIRDRDYFMEASSDNISEAFDEFEGDYAEEDLRLMRLKLHSKHGN